MQQIYHTIMYICLMEMQSMKQRRLWIDTKQEKHVQSNYVHPSNQYWIRLILWYKNGILVCVVRQQTVESCKAEKQERMALHIDRIDWKKKKKGVRRRNNCVVDNVEIINSPHWYSPPTPIERGCQLINDWNRGCITCLIVVQTECIIYLVVMELV